MSQPGDERNGRAGIEIASDPLPSDDEGLIVAATPADAVARRPARVIDGDLARLIAEGKVGTAEALGMTEADVLAGLWASDEAAVAQIEDHLRKDNAQSRRGGEYKAWEGKYPAWVSWRNALAAMKSAPSVAAELKNMVEREARARRRSELVRDAETYLRDRHLDWDEHLKMLQLARELGLPEADVEWAYAEVTARVGSAFTRSSPPSPASDVAAPPEPAAGASPAPPSSRRALPSFEWVATLHTVEQRVGLLRVDEGIEATANVRREQLASGRAHTAVMQQRLGIEQRLPALRSQESALQYEERRARIMQNGAALMQVQGQQQRLAYERHALETQHQQLGVELQRLDVEVQREERDAIENELLRMFVDLHDLVKSAFHAGRSADAFLFIIVAERVYAQVYRWAQNPHNRMTLSGIRDANAASLATLMGSDVARRAIFDCFDGGTAPYVELLRSERAAEAALAATLAEYPAHTRLFLDAGALTRAMGETRAYGARLAQCRNDLAAILEARRRHADVRYLREFLLVPCGTVLPDMLRRFNGELTAMRTELEQAIGEPLAGFGQAALTMDERLASQIHECVRVLGLVDLVTARQHLVGALPSLNEWQRSMADVIADLRARAASLAVPQGATRADIQLFISIAVLLSHAREAVAAVQSGAEANRVLLDPQFVIGLPGYFQVSNPEADVIPWCQSFAHRAGELRGLAQQVLDRASHLASAAADWRSATIAIDPPPSNDYYPALQQEVAVFLAPGMDDAINAEVRVKLSTLGTKLVTAFTSAKSAERKQQQAYLDIAIQKLSDAAITPLQRPDAPAVSIPA